VVLSGALDAWRYRADESGGFDTIWRGLAADAAMAAPRRINVSVSPPIARPGDEILVSATLRETEIGRLGTDLSLPAVAASAVGPDGRREMIRLWPTTRPGQYEGRLVATAEGRHVVSASAATVSAEVPLLVAADVVHPSSDLSAASTHAAEGSGGAVVADASGLMRALTAVGTGEAEKTTRPMRSVWWLVPFSLLLCAEWTLRRRAGLK
jgi:hypothetical protein